MWWLILILGMGILARLAGSGFGKQWGVSWLPELIFAAVFGASHAYAWCYLDAEWWKVLIAFVVATGATYGGMQSGTWTFLRWESHDDPNTSRGGTLKAVFDWIAARFGYKLGDEGYAWIAAGVKGFLIGLPVGGLQMAILWPLSYEIGSHADGRVERFGFDPHAIKEILSGISAGIGIFIFINALWYFA